MSAGQSCCVSFFLGDAPSLHRCPVPILSGHWPPAAHGSHCCDLPWRSCSVHDSDCRPSLPHGDRPAAQHHCSRSGLQAVFVYVLNTQSKIHLIDSEWISMCWPLFNSCVPIVFFSRQRPLWTHHPGYTGSLYALPLLPARLTGQHSFPSGGRAAQPANQPTGPALSAFCLQSW